MRLKTPIIRIGEVRIGGDNPIAIQSMTNTNTADAFATAKQCILLADAGAELVRITVNDENAAKAVPKIRKILNQKGYKNLPLIGDFHFNGHILLKKFPECAKALDKYRINPGNLGYGKNHDQNFATILGIAKKYSKPVRIGVNMGSLDRELLTVLMQKNARKKNPSTARDVLIEAMVKSAMDSADFAEKKGLTRKQIVLSVKMSDVPDVVAAYKKLVKKMLKKQRIYALHLGLTEAGSGQQGIVHSVSALSILLQEGIGDTIRVSLTPDKNTPREQEVKVCKDILQALSLRRFSPRIISCPGCGRTDNEFFQKMAAEINNYLEKNSARLLKKYPQLPNLKIAVMGCVVNGPGESSHADIGISLPGKSEQKIAVVYINGKLSKNLVGKNLEKNFLEILEEYLKNYLIK